MSIALPINPALGTNVHAFPKKQYDKIKEIIDTINTITSGTVTLTDVQVSNGTAALPTITFASDLNTGIYRVGSNDIGITTNGVLAFDISATTGTLALPLVITDATDATTSTTGSLKTAGGLGVAKALFVGTTLNNKTAANLATVSGTTTIGASNPLTVSTSGVLTVNNSTILNGTTNINSNTIINNVVAFNTNLIRTNPSTGLVAAGTTIGAAALLTGYVEITGTTNSSAFGSAANIISALSGSYGIAAAKGTTFDCYINTMGATPMTAGNVLTVTAGAGMQFMKQISAGDSASPFLATITATAGVHSGIFRFTFDTATTCSVQRIG